MKAKKAMKAMKGQKAMKSMKAMKAKAKRCGKAACVKTCSELADVRRSLALFNILLDGSKAPF